MHTISAKPGTVERSWWVVDADGQNLGRLATVIAETIRGKRSPWFTRHADTGDFVVVVNAELIDRTVTPVARVLASSADAGEGLASARALWARASEVRSPSLGELPASLRDLIASQFRVPSGRTIAVDARATGQAAPALRAARTGGAGAAR